MRLIDAEELERYVRDSASLDWETVEIICDLLRNASELKFIVRGEE